MRLFTFAASLLLAAGLAGPAAAAPAARSITISTQGGANSHQRITMSLDKAAIVQLDTDARDVLVSNPDIVDAVVRTPRRIFLLAQKTGQTNAFFFDTKGRQILTIDIRVERDVTDLSTMMRANMAGADIKVSAMNDNIVLTGTVTNAADATRAADLAARFAGAPDKVVNMLKITARDQVMLSVRVAEVQRSIAKQFGVDLATAMRVGGVPLVASTGNQFSLLGRALADLSGLQAGSVCPGAIIPGAATSTCTSSPNDVQGVLKALERVGLMHTLAEPNLTAVSGETAKFLAGGEFPVPVSRDRDGNITIEFKPFGVGLSFTPIVLSENRISLQISTEVSELTNTGSFTLSSGSSTTSGVTIPALSVRRAATTVELPSGGSFAVAGLLQNSSRQAIDAFPGVKDLPVLGALFRSRDYQNDQSELVVLVSAYLVDPTKASKIALPTDGFIPATDPETILMGKLNNTHGPEDTGARAAAPAKTGFIVP